MKPARILFAIAALFAITATSALAFEATGQVQVTGEVIPKCVIKSLPSINFGQLSLADDGTASEVTANIPSLTYWCTADAYVSLGITLANAGGKMVRGAGGAGNEIPYQVAQIKPYLNSGSPSQSVYPLTSGATINNIWAGGPADTTNQLIDFVMVVSDYANAKVGNYSDTITLTFTY